MYIAAHEGQFFLWRFILKAPYTLTLLLALLLAMLSSVPANARPSTRSFVPSTAPRIGSFTVSKSSVLSGDIQTVRIQLTQAAPQGGAVVSLSSSNPAAAPVPATFTVPAGLVVGQFQFQIGPVTTLTQVTLTATLNSRSVSASFTIQVLGLQLLSAMPSTITGGAQTPLMVTLNGPAPAGGKVVSLASSNPSLASVPATVTVGAGINFTFAIITTNAVQTNTAVTISASLNGTTLQTQVTLTPQLPPESVALSSSVITGPAGSDATVSVASAPATDLTLPISCDNPAVATCPSKIIILAGSTSATFRVVTNPVLTQQLVNISVSGAGVTKTATLTVNPAPSTLPAPTLISPAEGAVFSFGQTVLFDWTDVPGAASYMLQMSNSDDFSVLVTNYVVSSSESSQTWLPPRTVYWRVQATSADGTPGVWSTVRTFTQN